MPVTGARATGPSCIANPASRCVVQLPRANPRSAAVDEEGSATACCGAASQVPTIVPAHGWLPPALGGRVASEPAGGGASKGATSGGASTPKRLPATVGLPSATPCAVPAAAAGPSAGRGAMRVQQHVSGPAILLISGEGAAEPGKRPPHPRASTICKRGQAGSQQPRTPHPSQAYARPGDHWTSRVPTA